MEWLSSLIALFIDPLAYGFMVRALLASIMVGILCPMLGSYIILLGMSFFGDALAHAILPGVVLAFLLDWPLLIGALVFGVLTPVVVGLLTQGGEVREDAAIGIVFAGSFALGVAMISTLDSLRRRSEPHPLRRCARRLVRRSVGDLRPGHAGDPHHHRLLQGVPGPGL